MQTFREGKLEFHFQDDWEAIIRYPTSNENPEATYAQNGLAKPLEFVANRKNKAGKAQIYFIKVVDVRKEPANGNHSISSFSPHALAAEVEQKIREAFYSLLLGSRDGKMQGTKLWRSFVERLQSAGSQIVVVLWLEADFRVLPENSLYHNLLQDLKRRLSNIAPCILICNTRRNPIEGLWVTNISSAFQHQTHPFTEKSKDKKKKRKPK